jgi:hypothetical protein
MAVAMIAAAAYLWAGRLLSAPPAEQPVPEPAGGPPLTVPVRAGEILPGRDGRGVDRVLPSGEGRRAVGEGRRAVGEVLPDLDDGRVGER